MLKQCKLTIINSPRNIRSKLTSSKNELLETFLLPREYNLLVVHEPVSRKYVG